MVEHEKKGTTEARGKGGSASASRNPKNGKVQGRTYLIVAAAIVIIAAAAVFMSYGGYSSSVPFSTFKSNLQDAKSVNLYVTYINDTQYSSEGTCFPLIIEQLAHTRKASTINFFLVNQTSCIYPKGGLGSPNVSLENTSVQNCLNESSSGPSIFLNYSSSNSTRITADRMYIYGNTGYMSECPIASDFG